MAEDYRRKLVNYLKRNFKKGYTEESLRWALINQGYSRILVDKSIETANKELAEKAPVIKEKPKINYQIIGENNRPIKIKKPWWKRVFG